MFVNGEVHLPRNEYRQASFTSYTTLTPHSCTRRDFHAYMMSRVQYTTYKIIAMCIERATTLWAKVCLAVHNW